MKKKKTIFDGKNFRNTQNYILGKKEKNKIISKFLIENFYYGIYKFMYGIKESLSWVHFVGYIYLLPFIIIISIYIENDIGILIFNIISPFIFILFILSKNFSKNKYSNVKNISFFNLFISDKGEMLNAILIIIFGFIIFGIYVKYLIWLILIFIILAFVNNKLFIKIFAKFGSSLIFRIRLFQILFIPIYLIIFFLYFGLFSFINLISDETQYYDIVKKKFFRKKFKRFEFLSKEYAENDFYRISKKGFKIKNLFKAKSKINYGNSRINKIRI